MKYRQALLKSSGWGTKGKESSRQREGPSQKAWGDRGHSAQPTARGSARSAIKGGGRDGAGWVCMDNERQEQGLEHGEQAGPETGLYSDGSAEPSKVNLRRGIWWKLWICDQEKQ